MSSGLKLLLSGGLGNQLFQYAALRTLAIRINASLTVDLRFYGGSRTESAKKPWLIDFPIKSRITDYSNDTSDPHSWPNRIYRRLISERPNKRYCSQVIGFDKHLDNLREGQVISGLFQSPLHFSTHWKIISNELDLVSAGLIEIPQEVAGVRLDKCIGLHVRRGDYLSHTGFEMRDPIAYYQRALRNFQDQSSSEILIFSDDPEWCRTQSIFAGAKYYPVLDQPPYVDMFTLAQCQRLIIANSSFSWWAAWFACQRGAPVVAPSEWILGIKSEQLEVLPSEWIKI